MAWAGLRDDIALAGRIGVVFIGGAGISAGETLDGIGNGGWAADGVTPRPEHAAIARTARSASARAVVEIT